MGNKTKMILLMMGLSAAVTQGARIQHQHSLSTLESSHNVGGGTPHKHAAPKKKKTPILEGVKEYFKKNVKLPKFKPLPKKVKKSGKRKAKKVPKVPATPAQPVNSPTPAPINLAQEAQSLTLEDLLEAQLALDDSNQPLTLVESNLVQQNEDELESLEQDSESLEDSNFDVEDFATQRALQSTRKP